MDVAAKLEAELATPPFPKSLEFIWRAYARLRNRQSMGFNGPEPIGWQDIDAFLRRSGVRLYPHEIAILEDLDDLYLTEAYRKAPAVDGASSAADADDPEAVREVVRRAAKRR